MKLWLRWAMGLTLIAATLPGASAQTPNLTITGVRIVDANDNPITPVAGQPFYVEIDWN
jgi:hypothetical protein